jgi:hypothetical protein
MATIFLKLKKKICGAPPLGAPHAYLVHHKNVTFCGAWVRAPHNSKTVRH